MTSKDEVRGTDTAIVKTEMAVLPTFKHSTTNRLFVEVRTVAVTSHALGPG
jgi:hypothetical protein